MIMSATNPSLEELTRILTSTTKDNDIHKHLKRLKEKLEKVPAQPEVLNTAREDPDPAVASNSKASAGAPAGAGKPTKGSHPGTEASSAAAGASRPHQAVSTVPGRKPAVPGPLPAPQHQPPPPQQQAQVSSRQQPQHQHQHYSSNQHEDDRNESPDKQSQRRK
jgi:hypothetical protein